MNSYRKTDGMLIALSLTALLSGCMMRVYESGSVISPTDRYSAGVVIRSGRGEALDERHEKTINISVRIDNKEPTEYLFRKELKLVAGNLDWKILWHGSESVEIRFFECPPELSLRSDAVVKGILACTVVTSVRLAKKMNSKEFEELQ